MFYAQHPSEDKSLVGRVTFVGDDAQEFTDAEAFLKCIREELPYFPTTGFRCEVLTDDPAVRKQVDDIFYDFFGEENPHQMRDYQNEPEQDMTFLEECEYGQKNGEFLSKNSIRPALASASTQWRIPMRPVAPGTEGVVDFVDDIGTHPHEVG